MSLDKRPADLSEDEELMFLFEESEQDAAFHSIDGVALERPVHPMAAILERPIARKRSCPDDDVEEPEADLLEEKPLAISRKRKTFELPSVPAQVIRPVAKRAKSNAYERSITAPACLMGGLSLQRTKEQQQEPIADLEKKPEKGPPRSASINIPDSFQPIHWPGDAAISRSFGRDRSQSCSSSSSTKSWASGLGLFCRRSCDVSSPLRVRFNDLVLHSSAGSYTGS